MFVKVNIKMYKKLKIKTTNALMKYLRDTHNISIGDSKDKRNLIQISIPCEIEMVYSPIAKIGI